MKHHEKKYRVDSFDETQQKLRKLGAKRTKSTSSTHYYAPQDSNNVIKLVHYSDRDEIHILKETDGTFSLADNITVQDLEDGFKWLRNKGFTNVDIVKMDYVDYEHESGIVGLYTLNDSAYSVILDFPLEQHSRMEETLGLKNAEVIAVPYSKYLKQIGLSQSKNIGTD